MEAAPVPSKRVTEPANALLDAAERMLVSDGYARITTRSVAAEAGVNHGLVHYYFGSMEELLLQVLERFTDRLVERQRAMYRAEGPFIDKWRLAMRYLDEDYAAGYPKIWLELQAMSWNRPQLQERVRHVDEEWRSTLRTAFAEALDEHGLDREAFPLEAVLALVMTFNKGFQLEQVTGIQGGHAELLAWIDGWLAAQERRA
ncbi:MAG TPA: TetR/AcrR family transcriptional regulator [Thermoleophilaceae bacterium]|nr:TetR/AcrR family transcriptional regulator [Thermoleophilaceae bacterium]